MQVHVVAIVILAVLNGGCTELDHWEGPRTGDAPVGNSGSLTGLTERQPLHSQSTEGLDNMA
jgi:hypothetical protein